MERYVFSLSSFHVVLSQMGILRVYFVGHFVDPFEPAPDTHISSSNIPQGGSIDAVELPSSTVARAHSFNLYEKVLDRPKVNDHGSSCMYCICTADV